MANKSSTNNKRSSDIPEFLMSTTALATAVLTLCNLATTQAAFGGQAAPTQAEREAQQTEVEEIVVTGSLVVRDGYEAPTPVTVIGIEQFESAATTTIADAINRMPELSGSVMPSSATQSVSQGSAGLNNLNLRGLGPTRTLVLLDGQRVVGANINNTFNNSGSVDVNTMPAGLVKRVDIVTGGASAAYGSDAVSGVVNFVLDHEFVGFKTDLAAGISGQGDNKTINGKATLGTTFAGDRGHITAYGAYSENGEVPGNARSWTERGGLYVPNPAYVIGNGQPQFIASRQVGLLQGAPGGVISSGPLLGIAFGPGGVPYNLQGQRNGLFLIGGDWKDTRIYQTVNIAPQQILGNAFTRVSYAVADNIEAWVQAQWAVASTKQKAGLPSTYFNNLTVASTNPFIPASIRTAMTNAGVASLPFGITNVAGGGVGIDFKRYTQRFAGGFDGTFDAMSTDWTWDADYQYSKSRSSNRTINNPISARLRQAIASVAGANGAPVCIDPSNSCVPYNPFGTGVNSQAANNFVTATGYHNFHLIQQSMDLHVAGTPLTIWAGDVSLAFGIDWRSESTAGRSSALDQATALNYGNWKPDFGKYTVTEGFAEAVVPLATDTSWARSLELNTAVRATSYSTSGYVTTWKVGATYQPIDDIRFRGSRSRDIRAPNLSELFTAGSFGQPTLRDPTLNNIQYLVNTLSGGNVNLKPEIADSLGVGVVLSPTFLPAFRASADYYRIDIKDAIQSVGGQNYVDLCFQGQTQYCQYVERDPVTRRMTLVRSTGENIAFQFQDGLDVEASYHLPVATGELTVRALGTFVFTATQSSLGNITDSAGASIPSFRANVSAIYNLDPFSTTLTMRYRNKGAVSNAFVVCSTGCPLSTTFNNTVNHNDIPSYALFDASFLYKLRDDTVDLYLAIDNILDKEPPFVPGGSSSGYLAGEAVTTFDRIGRMFRGGIRFRM